MNIHKRDHPLWPTLRVFALTIAVTFLLWINASSFDETEVMTIVEIAVIVGGYEGMTMLRDKKGKK